MTIKPIGRYPIPPEIFKGHAAFIGRTNSGKTHAAKGGIERLLAALARVCIFDPTGVYWGMRSSADGQRAGFSLVILGGDHGDLPLNPNAGEEIARIVAESTDSFIFDTSNLTLGEQTKFFTDFALNIRRFNRNPLTIVIDEADNFIPQGRVNDPQSAMMVSAGNKLLTAGRARGIRVILITQRPAQVHKNSLSQIGALIIMRLIAPQDRKAVEEWVRGAAEAEDAKKIMSTVASLKQGEGWIYAPELELLKRDIFPPLATFDSGRAPDGEARDMVLAKIDLAAIGQRMTAAVAIKADSDPELLRARIRELEKAKAGQAAPAMPEAELHKIKTEHFEHGQRAGFEAGKAHGLSFAWSTMAEFIKKCSTGNTIDLIEITPPAIEPIKFSSKVVQPSGQSLKKGDVVHDGKHGDLIIRAVSSSDGPTAPQCRLLDALATLKALGMRKVKRGHVAGLAGVSPLSSGFEKNLGRLKTLGLVAYPAQGEVSITDAGAELAAPPAERFDRQSLHASWYGIVKPARAAMLRAIVAAYPHALSREKLAEKIDVSAKSSGFEKNLGALRSLGLIDYPAPGLVAATDLLFPD